MQSRVYVIGLALELTLHLEEHRSQNPALLFGLVGRVKKSCPTNRVEPVRVQKFGGDNEIRTHDLCSAIAALSQLSYIPVL